MGEGLGGTPVGVPVVGRDWMVECLKRSAVVAVAVDAHLLTRPLRKAAPSRFGETTAGAAAAASATAAAAAAVSAAGAAPAAAGAAPAPAARCTSDAKGKGSAWRAESARDGAALPRGSRNSRSNSSASGDSAACQPLGGMPVVVMAAAGVCAIAGAGAG
ncbi:unnamed protein product, partial [Laminaria digitata]